MRIDLRRTAQVLFCLLFLGLCPAPALWGPNLGLYPADAQQKETRMILDVNPENRDVGLKRMELLDKALTPEIIQKKNTLVTLKEEEYNRKIGELVRRLTTPAGNNTIISHLDVSFLDPGFDQQILARERVSVTILLDRDGFAKWARGKSSEDHAREQMAELVGRAFRIPLEQISIVVAPN